MQIAGGELCPSILMAPNQSQQIPSAILKYNIHALTVNTRRNCLAQSRDERYSGKYTSFKPNDPPNHLATLPSLPTLGTVTTRSCTGGLPVRCRRT